MQYNEDELLFKAVIEDMGLVWDDTPGEITVEGIPATDYIKNGSLFEQVKIQYQSNVEINSRILQNQSIKVDLDSNFLYAA